ncbi:hypothetical protein AXG93_1151s1000 [Marchantia polymorpha subsp. ruderalis]|uniref:Uncharacterized protein n=1 Tax=Marchantia polymorpha subsp. ruderalis TaxID=1480154 RepID=A0A176VUI5_MARPO|nr:hypothetical protein AXG93_1151s1000 [Marchantia polymorpha subsp. ruderalis]
MPSAEDRRTESRPTAGRTTEGRPVASRQEQRAQPDSRPEAAERTAAEPIALEASSSEEDNAEEEPPAKRSCGEKTCRIDPAASVRTPSADIQPAKTPSAHIAPEDQTVGVGGTEVAEVPAATTPSRSEAQAEAEAQAVGSPTALDILAGSGVAIAEEAAEQHSSRESPRASMATEILETEDETSSEAQEADSMRGTPTGILCEQIVPLLRYLDRKAVKYGNPRKPQSYVELVKNRTKTKVATNPALVAWGIRCRDLEKKNAILEEHLGLTKQLQKALREKQAEVARKAQENIDLLRARVELELQEERKINCMLTAELARALEQGQNARKSDEELLRNLQSECAELRAQRAEAEMRLAEWRH